MARTLQHLPIILKAHQLLDTFIRAGNRKVALALPVEQLVSELYKMRNFDWGGNYQNNLDRYIVDNFIKTIPLLI